MSDKTNLIVTADFTPFDVNLRKAEVDAGILEIESAGVTVTSVHFTSPTAPIRYFIRFNSDEPQWQVRMRLEEKHYDVGSKHDRNALGFYVTKRTEETKGWAT